MLEKILSFLDAAKTFLSLTVDVVSALMAAAREILETWNRQQEALAS